jgi:hypothetical protein
LCDDLEVLTLRRTLEGKRIRSKVQGLARVAALTAGTDGIDEGGSKITQRGDGRGDGETIVTAIGTRRPTSEKEGHF